MRLFFKINSYYLLFHSLERTWNNKPFPEWFKLAQTIKSSSWFIFKNRGVTFSQIKNDQKLKQSFLQTADIFLKILKSSAFKRLLKETEDYRDWVEQEWSKNKNTALSLLKDITGLNIPNIPIKVFITHPKLTNGFNIPEKRIIFWGHPEEWKSYTIVYLCHEILHIILHKKYKDATLIHALIELATDNELRIRLNQEGKYFKEKGHEVGHSWLRPLEKKILPIWKNYLRKDLKCRNIIELEKILLERYEKSLKNKTPIMFHDRGN